MRTRKDYENARYSWTHEFNLYSNPLKLKYVLKVMGIVYVVILGIIMLAVGADNLLMTVLHCVGVFVALEAVAFVAYFLLMAYVGGKCDVAYKIDDTKVTMRQVKPFRGTRSGKWYLIADGVQFKDVIAIEEKPSKDLIMLRTKRNKYSIYTPADQYDEIIRFINAAVLKNILQQS